MPHKGQFSTDVMFQRALRDWFATHWIVRYAGMDAAYIADLGGNDAIARNCYALADAMMVERIRVAQAE